MHTLICTLTHMHTYTYVCKHAPAHAWTNLHTIQIPQNWASLTLLLWHYICMYCITAVCMMQSDVTTTAGQWSLESLFTLHAYTLLPIFIFTTSSAEKTNLNCLVCRRATTAGSEGTYSLSLSCDLSSLAPYFPQGRLCMRVILWTSCNWALSFSMCGVMCSYTQKVSNSIHSMHHVTIYSNTGSHIMAWCWAWSPHHKTNR